MLIHRVPLIAKLAALAASFALPTGIVVAADSSAAVRSQTLSYRGLSLSDEKGVEVLYGRIRSAARRVCTEAGNRHVRDWDRESACRKKAVADAVEAVHSAKLEALHRQRTTAPTRLAQRGV